MHQLPSWITHYNEVHPHKALGYLSPREFIVATKDPDHARPFGGYNTDIHRGNDGNRSKAAIINLAFRDALTEVVAQLLRKPGEYKHQLKDRSEELARDWFSDPNVRKQIAEFLPEFDLDETALEAEAFRKSADDLEGIDRLMASAEARRDKALVCIAQYRGDFGVLLRESSDRLVDGKVLKLEHAGSKERKPAA
jgi:hypothetical protein